jgi:altronate dehydratase
VQTDTDHWVENVTGLAACGAHLVVGAVGDGPQQGHPLIPVVQVAGAGVRDVLAEEDVDFVASGSKTDPERLVELVLATARRDVVPAAQAGGFVEFQLTRGLLGVST